MSLFYDTHMHTPLCQHAKGDPTEYAAVAHARGLAGIVITDHCPLPDDVWAAVRMMPGQFPTYVQMVTDARAEWAGRVDVRLGIESDYYPGLESYLGELHARADFDYVIGSVHPQNPDYRQRYLNGGDIPAYQRLYFEHLALAAESGLFDALAHPDLVKIVFPMQWGVGVLLDDIRRCLDRVAAAGVALELNTSGLHKTIREMNPGRVILDEMHARAIPVIVGSDAHNPARVGADFEAALDLLAEVGYAETCVFIGRDRRTIPIAEFRASLTPA